MCVFSGIFGQSVCVLCTIYFEWPKEVDLPPNRGRYLIIMVITSCKIAIEI